jgi:hypothetical protein
VAGTLLKKAAVSGINATQQAHLECESAKSFNRGARPASVRSVVEGGAARTGGRSCWTTQIAFGRRSRKARADAGGGGGGSDERKWQRETLCSALRSSYEGAGRGKWNRHSAVNGLGIGGEGHAVAAVLCTVCALGKMHAVVCVCVGVGAAAVCHDGMWVCAHDFRQRVYKT